MGPKTRTEEELWAADPALMQRAIGASVDKLYSIYNGLAQLPDWFEPAAHGVPLRKSLKELDKALRSADATDFERLPLSSAVSTGGGALSSSDVARLQRSLDLVQKERDDLLERKRLGESAVAQLNTKVERLQSELAGKAPSVSDRATLAKLDAANERATTLEAETAKLKAANLRLREQAEKNTQKLSTYEELGSPRELAQLVEAYRHHGSPDDISDRFGRLHSVASLSKLLVQSMDSACIQYEAIVGPLVLLQERSQRALAAFFSVLDPDNAFDRVNDLSRPLVPAAARLSGTDITLQSVKDAVNAVVQSRGDSYASRGQVSAGELVREYRDLLPTVGDAYGRLLLDRRDIAKAYSSLLTQSTCLQDRPMHVPSTLKRAARGTPRLPEDEADNESVYEREAESELSDVSDNDDGEYKATESKARTPPRENISGQFHSIRQPALIARRGSASRKPNLGREALSSGRTDVSKHEIQRRAAFLADQKRLRSKAEPWPKGPPSPENRLRIDSRFLREMPWRFQIFGTKEQTAPVKREYTRIVINDLPDRRFPPLQEVMDLYETRPWRILMHPPGPITFPPDTSRPDLARSQP